VEGGLLSILYSYTQGQGAFIGCCCSWVGEAAVVGKGSGYKSRAESWGLGVGSRPLSSGVREAIVHAAVHSSAISFVLFVFHHAAGLALSPSSGPAVRRLQLRVLHHVGRHDVRVV
jgi:hypothetical protein